MRYRAAVFVLCAGACASPVPDVPSPLHAHLTEAGFSGAALVVSDGEQLLRVGIGLADLELGVANTPDLIYGIGSLTKPITASAVLAATADGHLALEDSVCSVLRDCPTDWADVQIRHLLNHTSGIPDLFGLLPEAPLLKTTAEVDRLLSEATSIPLDSPPGSEYAYSNFNYVLLGYVLREATGRDWETYLRERVLEPVGASDTEYDDVWAVVERKAHGYGFENGELRKIEYGDHSAYAAGGLLSTVDDLRRWQEALEAGRIVPVAVLDEMFTPHAGGYGYGWQIIRALGRELRNHTGGVDGYASHLAWYPDERLLIVLLSNVEGAPVKALACDVARIVLQDPVQPNTSAEWLSQGVGDRCDQEAL